MCADRGSRGATAEKLLDDSVENLMIHAIIGHIHVQLVRHILAENVFITFLGESIPNLTCPREKNICWIWTPIETSCMNRTHHSGPRHISQIGEKKTHAFLHFLRGLGASPLDKRAEGVGISK